MVLGYHGRMLVRRQLRDYAVFNRAHGFGRDFNRETLGNEDETSLVFSISNGSFSNNNTSRSGFNGPDVRGSSLEVAWTNRRASCRLAPERGRGDWCRMKASFSTAPRQDASRIASVSVSFSCTVPTFKAPMQLPIDQQTSMDR